MADPWVAIIPEACDLKRKDPEQFDRFVASLKAYSQQLVVQYLSAGKGSRAQAQGRCQAIIDLTERLGDCFNLEAKYRKRT